LRLGCFCPDSGGRWPNEIPCLERRRETQRQGCQSDRLSHVPNLPLTSGSVYRYCFAMAKNKLAVGLGKLRWKGKTKAQKRAHMRMMGLKSAAAKAAKKVEKPLDS